MKRFTIQMLKRGFILFLFANLFISCSPEYIPNMVNSPMFSERGEFQLTLATGNSSFDAQTAVAVSNHIGIMVNGSYGNETNDSSDAFHKHKFIEGGIGYFEKIGDKGRFEVYGGYGTGEIDGFFEGSSFFDENITHARYNRFFIQPGIGISTVIFEGSFSPRIVLVQMDAKQEYYGSVQYNTFIEPVITAKVGYKYVKFIAQLGASFHVGDQKLLYEHQHFIFNFGLNLSLGKKYLEN